MASGFFPIEPGSQEGRDLLIVATGLEKFIMRMQDDCLDNVPEDALTDGMYIGELSVALNLIKRALRKTA